MHIELCKSSNLLALTNSLHKLFISKIVECMNLSDTNNCHSSRINLYSYLYIRFDLTIAIYQLILRKLKIKRQIIKCYYVTKNWCVLKVDYQ